MHRRGLGVSSRLVPAMRGRKGCASRGTDPHLRALSWLQVRPRVRSRAGYFAAVSIFSYENTKSWPDGSGLWHWKQPVRLAFSLDRKSTRLNSSHEWISYAVFCLKKKKNEQCSATIKKTKKQQYIA